LPDSAILRDGWSQNTRQRNQQGSDSSALLQNAGAGDAAGEFQSTITTNSNVTPAKRNDGKRCRKKDGKRGGTYWFDSSQSYLQSDFVE
jgi:hypothetical protein